MIGRLATIFISFPPHTSQTFIYSPCTMNGIGFGTRFKIAHVFVSSSLFYTLPPHNTYRTNAKYFCSIRNGFKDTSIYKSLNAYLCVFLFPLRVVVLVVRSFRLNFLFLVGKIKLKHKTKIQPSQRSTVTVRRLHGPVSSFRLQNDSSNKISKQGRRLINSFSLAYYVTRLYRLKDKSNKQTFITKKNVYINLRLFEVSRFTSTHNWVFLFFAPMRTRSLAKPPFQLGWVCGVSLLFLNSVSLWYNLRLNVTLFWKICFPFHFSHPFCVSPIPSTETKQINVTLDFAKNITQHLTINLHSLCLCVIGFRFCSIRPLSSLPTKKSFRTSKQWN